MLAHQHLPAYTYKDYQQWEGDWELIGGIPFSMSPSPKGNHQHVASNLVVELGTQVRNCEDCFIYYEHDWIIAPDTIVRPDIYITCDGTVSDYLKTPPQLVIEILSQATRKKDWGLKYSIYESQGVPYYLVVDTETKRVYIHLLAKKQYHLLATKSKGTFEFELKNCKISLNISSIWMN